MKKLFTIIVCKVLKFVGGLLGKGSSLPGQIALKLCPDILGRIELPKYIVAVTGSNGKTSTVEMKNPPVTGKRQKSCLEQRGF